MLNLCIYHKDVSFIIDKNITRHYIPNLVLTVPETAILSGLLEAEGSQIGVNLNLCGWMGIGYGLHLWGYLHVALHVLRKVARADRRLLRCGYFPHLALRHFLVELVEKCHDSSFFSCFRCKIKHKFWIIQLIANKKNKYSINMTKLEKLYSIIEGNMGTGSCFIILRITNTNSLFS